MEFNTCKFMSFHICISIFYCTIVVVFCEIATFLEWNVTAKISSYHPKALNLKALKSASSSESTKVEVQNTQTRNSVQLMQWHQYIQGI